MRIHPKELSRVQTSLCALLLFFCLTGCVTSYEDQALRKVYEHHTNAIVEQNTANGALVATNPTERNRTLRQLIYLVDRHYENWEKRLFDKKASFDFFGTVSVIGVNAVGTLTGGEETKAILHAISGGIEGTKTAVDKDILQGQNTLAIITKMRELRAKKLTPLLEGMHLNMEAYPMEQALIDLGEYYNAGTFTVALQDIIATAGKEKDKTDEKNKAKR